MPGSSMDEANPSTSPTGARNSPIWNKPPRPVGFAGRPTSRSKRSFAGLFPSSPLAAMNKSIAFGSIKRVDSSRGPSPPKRGQTLRDAKYTKVALNTKPSDAEFSLIK